MTTPPIPAVPHRPATGRSPGTKRQIILGATGGGVNNGTIWADPAAGSQIDFAPLRQIAQTAERGRFHFFFTGEGLALRERSGRIFEHEVIGRPDTLTLLAALAGVTSHLGLIGTLNSTFNEPYELARQLASLDHLSGGRAGWNVVTSLDSFTGRNFRRGGFLTYPDRYTRAAEFLALARQLWESWAVGEPAADTGSGRFLAHADAGAFAHEGQHFAVSGRFTVPRCPQGHPVIVQAGVSAQGREFAAAGSDIVFSPHNVLADAQEFYRDIQARAVRNGRPEGEVKVLPGGSFVLGDSDAEALERYREIAENQVGAESTLVFFESVWNRDLSAYDPDGPLPDVEPEPDGPRVIAGGVGLGGDAFAVARAWRALAEERGFTMRQLATHFFGLGRNEFVGSPQTVAAHIDDFVQNRGSDGFIIGAHLNPTGLGEFVDRVIPLLQERGSFHTEYTGATLRENLGLPALPAAG